MVDQGFELLYLSNKPKELTGSDLHTPVITSSRSRSTVFRTMLLVRRRTANEQCAGF
jgi:hypothetical protein